MKTFDGNNSSHQVIREIGEYPRQRIAFVKLNHQAIYLHNRKFEPMPAQSAHLAS